MRQEDAETLLNKYKNGTATQEEINRLLDWIQSAKFDHDIDITTAELESADQEMWKRISPHIRSRTITLWPRIAAAASVIIAVCLSGVYLFRHRLPAHNSANAIANIKYGSGKAILKMGNGKSVILDNNLAAVLAAQGNTAVTVKNNGVLAYTGAAPTEGKVIYDTIQNPAGGNIHHIKLADGTAITLNAATTLIYPERFSKKERKIELTDGEAYFEVAHRPGVPFSVLSHGQLIEDIGTHFNISAYQAEPVITTLLEGSVKVWHQGQTAILNPGQKAVTQSTIPGIAVDKADTDAAIAWAQGLFMFNDERLEAIMKQISRWYNVSIVYEDNALKNKLFSGSVSRFGNASQVLSKLELTGSVHFKITERRIVVAK